MSMNPEIKAQWVAALRSGEYRQGGGSLYNIGHNTHCCLGVLCELAVKAGVIPPFTPADNFAGHNGALPRSVVEWVGLESSDPYDVKGRTLSDMNDTGVPFAEIADVIERDL